MKKISKGKDKTKTALQMFEVELNEAFDLIEDAVNTYQRYIERHSDNPDRDSEAGYNVLINIMNQRNEDLFN